MANDAFTLPGFEPLPTVVDPQSGVVRLAPDVIGDRSPEERDIIDGFMEAYRPRLHDFPDPNRPVGKTGIDLDAQYQDGWYQPIGQLEVVQDKAFVRRDEDGQLVPYDPTWARDPNTGRVYQPQDVEPLLYTPPKAGEEPTVLGLPTRASASQLPGLVAETAFIEPFRAISRARERYERGLIVPDQTAFAEASQVAGLVTSGGLARRAIRGGVADRDLVSASADSPSIAPADLDPAGFYSQVHRTVPSLPDAAPAADMFGMLSNRPSIREIEVQTMNLDRFLLGDEVANARREVLRARDQLARFQKQLQDEGHDDLSHPEIKNELDSDLQAVNEAVKKLQDLTTIEVIGPDLEMQRVPMPTRRVTRDEVMHYVQTNRNSANETVYVVPKWSDEVQKGMDTLINNIYNNSPDFRNFMDSLQLNGSPLDHYIREVGRNRSPHGLQNFIGSIIDENPGVSDAVILRIKKYLNNAAGTNVYDATPVNKGRVLQFADSMLEPRNPSNRAINLRIETPEIRRLEQSIKDLSDAEKSIVRDYARNTTPNYRRTLKYRYPKLISHFNSLDRTPISAYPGGHFSDVNAMAFSLLSNHKSISGRNTLFINQIQSDWANDLTKGYADARHNLVESLNRWLDPMIRRIIKEAVDQNLDSITIPAGKVVDRYNSITPEIMRMYDMVLPQRIRTILREMDKKYPHRGMLHDQLAPGVGHSSPGGYTEFPLTPAIRSSVKKGLRLYSNPEDTRAAAVQGAAAASIDRMKKTSEHPDSGLVLAYHGTPRSFDRFDVARSQDLGTHFGTSLQASNRVQLAPGSGRTLQNARVIPAIIEMRKPLTLKDQTSWAPAAVANEVFRVTRSPRAARLIRDIEEVSRSRPRINMASMSANDPQMYQMIREALTDMGYDGIRYWNTHEGAGWSYIVWNPGQVRSATTGQRLNVGGVPTPTESSNGSENQVNQQGY